MPGAPKPSTNGTAALRRVRGVAGTAARAYLQLNLTPERYARLIEVAGLREPSFVQPPGRGAPGTLPGAACLESLERAGQSDNFELETHWRMLVLGGGAGAGMFLHADTLRTSSWQMQIRGRKRWHLCPGPGGVQAASHTYCGAAKLDTFDPDYRDCSAFRKAECLEGVLAPGETLYYPEDYWHQTQSLDEGGAAISGTLVTPSNGGLVAAELRSECNGANRIIARSSTHMCAALATCLAGWAALKSDAPLATPPAPPPGRPAGRSVPQIGRFADGLP